MKNHVLTAALCAAFTPGAWAQQNNERIFTSGPGTGYTVRNGSPVPANTPFTISGFSIVGSPGASISGVEAGCSSTHVHGSFFGIADPGGGGCGHGIIGLSGGATVVPGAGSGGSSLSNGSAIVGAMPNGAMGQLALNGPRFSNQELGDLFIYAFGAATTAGSPTPPNTLDGIFGNDSGPLPVPKPLTATIETDGGLFFGGTFRIDRGDVESQRAAEAEQMAAEISRQLAVADLRQINPEVAGDAPKPPGAAAQSSGSILDTIDEPGVGDLIKAGSTVQKDKPQGPQATPQDRELDDTAQKAVDAIFSGDAQKSEIARKALRFASPELLNRVGQKINARVQNIVRTSLNNAVGVPRVPGQ